MIPDAMTRQPTRREGLPPTSWAPTASSADPEPERSEPAESAAVDAG